MSAASIIDSHVYLGESIFGWGVAADELIARLEAAGVGRAVAVPVKPRGYHLGPENDRVAAAQRATPDRIRGFCRVDPNLGGEAVDELERALGELGLHGLFLHPWEEQYRVSAPLLDPLMEVVRRHEVPVIVATGYPYVSEGLQVADLARRFPDVQIVMTNGGQLNLSGLGQTDAELALEQCPNLTLQTAGVYREDFIEGCVARFGADRVLYASSCPLMEPRLEVKRIQWAPNLTDDQRALMLTGNAERILWR